jgi:hypothetical protein
MGPEEGLNFDSLAAEKDERHGSLGAPSIVSVGSDPEILRLRHEMIARHSDVQIRSITPEEAETWTQRSEPHLWVFCHSVELTRLLFLACSIRRFSPGSRLLLLSGARSPSSEMGLFHQVIRPIDGVEMEAFLDHLSEMSLAV